MVILVVDGPRKGEVFRITGTEPIAVGRQGPLTLSDDMISRRHARFVPQDGAWFLEDLGSTNGTFVNQERVIYPTRLYSGDAVHIGRTTLVLADAAVDPPHDQHVDAPQHAADEYEPVHDPSVGDEDAVPVGAVFDEGALGADANVEERIAPAARVAMNGSASVHVEQPATDEHEQLHATASDPLDEQTPPVDQVTTEIDESANDEEASDGVIWRSIEDETGAERSPEPAPVMMPAWTLAQLEPERAETEPQVGTSETQRAEDQPGDVAPRPALEVIEQVDSSLSAPKLHPEEHTPWDEPAVEATVRGDGGVDAARAEVDRPVEAIEPAGPAPTVAPIAPPAPQADRSSKLPVAPQRTVARARPRAVATAAVAPEMKSNVPAVQRIVPQPLGAPGAPLDYEPPPMASLRRWLPTVVMLVLILAVAAQFMLYVRSQQTMDRLESAIVAVSKRDRTGEAEMLEALRREIRVKSQDDRNLLLQEMAQILDQRDQAHAAEREAVRQLVLEMRSRALAETVAPTNDAAPVETPQQTAGASVADTDIADGGPAPASNIGAPLPQPASGQTGPDVEPSSASASAGSTLVRPERADVVFLVDATGALADAAPLVREEIIRELARLRLDEQAWVVLRTNDGLVEFRPEQLNQLTKDQTAWSAALAGLGDNGTVRDPAADLKSATQRSLSYGPAQVFLLSDTLGGDAGRLALRAALQERAGSPKLRLHVLHFFARAGRDDLRAVARENGGTYSFVPGPATAQ